MIEAVAVEQDEALGALKHEPLTRRTSNSALSSEKISVCVLVESQRQAPTSSPSLGIVWFWRRSLRSGATASMSRTKMCTARQQCGGVLSSQPGHSTRKEQVRLFRTSLCQSAQHELGAGEISSLQSGVGVGPGSQEDGASSNVAGSKVRKGLLQGNRSVAMLRTCVNAPGGG